MAVNRTGYQCAAGGDDCPGHRSKWGMCTPAEFQPARKRTAEEDRALEERALADHLAEPTKVQHDATIAHLREQALRRKAATRGGQTDVFDEARGHWAGDEGR